MSEQKKLTTNAGAPTGENAHRIRLGSVDRADSRRSMLRHLGFVFILTVLLTACAVTDMPQGGMSVTAQAVGAVRMNTIRDGEHLLACYPRDPPNPSRK